MGEFDLIARYFKRDSTSALQPRARTATDLVAKAAATPPIALGIGDDCALLTPAPGQQLAVSTDMLVVGALISTIFSEPLT